MIVILEVDKCLLILPKTKENSEDLEHEDHLEFTQEILNDLLHLSVQEYNGFETMA